MARQATVPLELTKGPFSLVEARRAGLTSEQLRGATWRRVARGIYVWVALPLTAEVALEAVHRRLPSGAAFSGRTAGWLHGVDLPACDPIEVTVPRSCGVSAVAGAIVRRSQLESTEIVRVRGVPCTTAVRTVIDLARHEPLVEAVVAVDLALHRRLVGLAELQAYVSSHPRSMGIVQVRRVVDLAEPASESPMETRLRLVLVLVGLPRPQAQIPLHDERGRFVGRPDLYYADQRLGLEYDGGSHRNSLVEDNRRQNRLVNAGFRLLRFTRADVLGSPDAVVAQVRDALGLRARTPVATQPRAGRS